MSHEFKNGGNPAVSGVSAVLLILEYNKKVRIFERNECEMKLGITMEGGASRTVFSCGVSDAFLEENIMPDYFIGVSAGIVYGCPAFTKE